MSVSSEKKLKQALLQFKSLPNDKKRKLDDATNFEETKCRKLSVDNTQRQSNNQQPANKKDLINGKLEATDASTMDVVVDLCESSNDSVAEKACPRIVSEAYHDETSSQNISLAHSNSENNVPNYENPVGNSSNKITQAKTNTKQSKDHPHIRKEDRERLKQEKERQKQEREKERLAKLEAKEEEKRQREEERKAKEEEKRQKAQAKEEERKAKEEEKRQKTQAKEEERRQKEEEKRQKEEEKRLKEEEKRQKDELEKKNKEKTAALFTNFFLKCKNTPMKNQTTESSEKAISTKFMPFEVKENMRLASITRTSLTPEKINYLDEILSHDSNFDISSLYLAQLRLKSYVPGHSENTWPLNSNDDDDDMKDETVVASRYRCKLLQFCENRRPAYWGTWRKQSRTVSGRAPFKLDNTYFEYDVDSDDEWVDEEPGESLGGSEDDLESEDDYELDNDMFVPHGYLSDEEGQSDEVPDESSTLNEQKLNILEKEFEAEMKEKTSKLKPRIYGCIWISNDVEKKGKDDVEDMLLAYRAVWNQARAPFCVKLENSTPTVTPSSKSKTTPQNMPVGVIKEFPDSFTPDLIKLIHGNKLSGQKLVDEFKLYVLSVDPALNLTKSCVFNKIREIGAWIPHQGCWVVNDDVRQQHNLLDLSPTKNTWKYVTNFETAPWKKSQNVAAANAEKVTPATSPVIVTTPTSSGNPKKTSSITKFIRVYKTSEKEKQSAEESSIAEAEK